MIVPVGKPRLSFPPTTSPASARCNWNSLRPRSSRSAILSFHADSACGWPPSSSPALFAAARRSLSSSRKDFDMARRNRWRAFSFGDRDGSRFFETRRLATRRHSGPCQRARVDGRFHERGGVPADGRNRLRHILQPVPQQAVDQRAKPPVTGSSSRRFKPIATSTLFLFSWKRSAPVSVTTATKAASIGRFAMASGLRMPDTPSIPTQYTGADGETEAWHSQRQPAGRDRRSVSPRGLQRSPSAAGRISPASTIRRSNAC